MKQKNVTAPAPRTLTAKQRLFVAEYLTDYNATRAAERAGYSKHTAQEQGSRLLSNVKVSAEIAAVQAERFERLEITAERVLRELAIIGFANMFDYLTITPAGEVRVDLARLNRDQAAAIGEVTVEEFIDRAAGGEAERVRRTKFKLCDKRAALVDLGRHLKLFTDRVELPAKSQADEAEDTKQKLRAKLLSFIPPKTA